MHVHVYTCTHAYVHVHVYTCHLQCIHVPSIYVPTFKTTQENLSLKMGQAQLEGEVKRLRGELQRRETALHRVEAQSASQGRELSVALQELSQLRGRLEEERKEVEVESSEGEGEETDPPQDSSANEMVGCCPVFIYIHSTCICLVSILILVHTFVYV